MLFGDIQNLKYNFHFSSHIFNISRISYCFNKKVTQQVIISISRFNHHNWFSYISDVFHQDPSPYKSIKNAWFLN